MMWLVQQVWLWMALSFLAGALLTGFFSTTEVDEERWVPTPDTEDEVAEDGVVAVAEAEPAGPVREVEESPFPEVQAATGSWSWEDEELWSRPVAPVAVVDDVAAASDDEPIEEPVEVVVAQPVDEVQQDEVARPVEVEASEAEVAASVDVESAVEAVEEPATREPVVAETATDVVTENADEVPADHAPAEEAEEAEEAAKDLVAEEPVEELSPAEKIKLELARLEAELAKREQARRELLEAESSSDAAETDAVEIDAAQAEAERLESERLAAERDARARSRAGRTGARRGAQPEARSVADEPATEQQTEQKAEQEAERLRAERAAEAKRRKAEQAKARREEAKRLKAEQAEQERLAAERAEAERAEAERIERARAEVERMERLVAAGEAAPETESLPAAVEQQDVTVPTSLPTWLDPEDESDAWKQGPYGPGSAYAPFDGSAPAGYQVKADLTTNLYHSKRSRFFSRTPADVWFETEEHAEAAGFTRWDKRATAAHAGLRNGAGDTSEA